MRRDLSGHLALATFLQQSLILNSFETKRLNAFFPRRSLLAFS
jgi:hypothetical protein